jgi:hypothetical protein
MSRGDEAARERTMQTSTEWQVSDFGPHFDAAQGGTCPITGMAFGAGARVRRATVNGAESVLSVQAMKAFDVRIGTTGWFSRFVLGTDKLAAAVADPTTRRIELMNRQGRTTAFLREGDIWTRRGKRCSLKQLLAQGRRAYALSAA